MRVAVARDPSGSASPQAVAAVERAADALAGSGYDVVEGGIPGFEESLAGYQDLVFGEFRLAWPVLERLLGENGRRYIGYGLARAPEVDLARHVAATATHLAIRRAWAEQQRTSPLLVGPVFDRPAPEPGADARSRQDYEEITRAFALCTATTFAGLPAVAVPTGVADGLPHGVQVVGPAFREDLCLDAAEAIEAVCGRFRPPLPPATAG